MKYLKKKSAYRRPDLVRIPLVSEHSLLQSSVRVFASGLGAEPYHDFFYEANPTLSDEGDPYEITFGD